MGALRGSAIMNAVTALTQYTNHPKVFERYLDLVGSAHTAKVYISECLLAVTNSADLQACTPQSIITSSLRAVTMSLHLDLDQAYLVPFKDQCTMITGYKGMYDMGMRTGKYRLLHAGHIAEGWVVKLNPITGEATHEQEPGAPRGVVAHFTLMDGFSKTIYMTLPEIHAHAAQYSKSYTWSKSPWKASDRSRERMEVKTAFRRLMLEWGIMSPIARQLIETEEEQQPDDTLPSIEGMEIIEGAKRDKQEIIKDCGF